MVSLVVSEVGKVETQTVKKDFLFFFFFSKEERIADNNRVKMGQIRAESHLSLAKIDTLSLFAL